MSASVTIDLEECCRMAGIPYRQTYDYSKDDEDEDSEYVAIHRTGDMFRIDSNFSDAWWYLDASIIARLFQQLKDDMDKLTQAERVFADMKRKCGDVDFKCHQRGASYRCNEYIVRLERTERTNDVIAIVENTKTKSKTEHKLGKELNEDVASSAIKLHIAKIIDTH